MGERRKVEPLVATAGTLQAAARGPACASSARRHGSRDPSARFARPRAGYARPGDAELARPCRALDRTSAMRLARLLVDCCGHARDRAHRRLHARRRRRPARQADLVRRGGPARARACSSASCCGSATSTRRSERLAATGRDARRATAAWPFAEPGAASALGLVPAEARGRLRPRPRRAARAERRERPRAASPSSGFERGRRPPPVAGKRRRRCTAAGRPRGERPLLNHLALLVDSARTTLEREARAARASRSPRWSTPPTRSPSSSGAPTASSSSTSSTSRASRSSERPWPTSSSPGPEWPGSSRPREARARGARRAACSRRATAPGGSMLLSSGVVWRHRDFERLPRASAPAATRRSSASCFERLDADLAWLESLGAPVVERETGNPRTTGVRFDTRGADGGARRGRRRAAARRAAPGAAGPSAGRPRHRRLPGRPRAGPAARDPRGGPPAAARDAVEHRRRAAARARSGRRRQRRARRVLRPQHAGAAGARRSAEFVALAQLYAPPRDGRRRATGSGIAARDLVGDRRRAVDRAPARRARLVPVPERTRSSSACASAPSGEMVDAAERGGRARRAASDGDVTVEVVAGITTTLGGLRVDDAARVAPGVYAAGARRRAASPPAATRAGSRPRSCSAGSRRASALEARDEQLRVPARSSRSGSRRSCCSSIRDTLRLAPVAGAVLGAMEVDSDAPPGTRPTRRRSSCARRPRRRSADAAGALAGAPREGARGGRDAARGGPPPDGAAWATCRLVPTSERYERVGGRDARADPPHAGVARSTSTSACPTRATAVRGVQRACACTCRSCRACSALSPCGSASTRGSRARASRSRAPIPGRGVPRALRDLDGAATR